MPQQQQTEAEAFVEERRAHIKNMQHSMNWYYTRMGEHTHVRVFTSGVKSGDLTFTNDEFEYIKSRCMAHLSPVKMFCNEETDESIFPVFGKDKRKFP